jgi:hypothetical protein
MWELWRLPDDGLEEDIRVWRSPRTEDPLCMSDPQPSYPRLSRKSHFTDFHTKSLMRARWVHKRQKKEVEEWLHLANPAEIISHAVARACGWTLGCVQKDGFICYRSRQKPLVDSK